MKFEDIINDVFEKEGGYVNDPKDPGGETKYGISKKAFPNVDIKSLTKKDAKKIYMDNYWKPSKAESIPEDLRHIYFDMCVNFGIRGAGRVLQRACNGKNKEKIEVDGRVGKNTIGACKNLESDRLRAYRVLRFGHIVYKNKVMEKFWYGWYRRALEV
tara:strand:+ start:136 stop:609 length:474 start_codon:yes stop_codon:yes gene_type:complete